MKDIFSQVGVTGLPPFGERAANCLSFVLFVTVKLHLSVFSLDVENLMWI